MHSLSVRAKLTIWYLVVTSTSLLVFGLLSLGALRFALLRVKKASVDRREQRLLRYLDESRRQATPPPLYEQLQNYALITHEGNLFELRGSDGESIFPRPQTSAAWISSAPENCAQPVFRAAQFDGQPLIVRCHLILLNGQLVRLYLGSSLEEDHLILAIYRDALLLLVPCLLGLAAVSGYLLSRHALHPVSRMTQAALGMGIANLSARLPVPPARDELRDLALAWNQLMGRLENAVNRLGQFSADVSHDLRTSITVILATSELSLHRRRSEKEHLGNFERIVTECRTASTMLDSLLSIARSDTFVHEVAFRKINLCELVIGGCRRVEDIADYSEIILNWSLPAQPIWIDGDELLLQRLIGILLDNAVKFTPESGEIKVSLFREEESGVVEVRDTGVGMSEEVRAHIFDRFYQADLRERKTEAGSGLGLSIARWIVEAHRAKLTVESTPLKGSVFQIRFPLPAVAPSADVPVEMSF